MIQFSFIPTMSHEILANILQCDVVDLALFENAGRDIDFVSYIQALKESTDNVSFSAVKNLVEDCIQTDIHLEVRRRIDAAKDRFHNAMCQSDLRDAMQQKGTIWLLDQLSVFDDISLSNFGDGVFVLEVKHHENMWDFSMKDMLEEIAVKYGLKLHCPVQNPADGPDGSATADSTNELMMDEA